MKFYDVPSTHLAADVKTAIIQGDVGTYFVYGIFVEDSKVNINRLMKGSFASINASETTDENGVNHLVFHVPVPEFVASSNDADWSKYVNLHFLTGETEKSDDVMLKEFAAAFAKHLAGEADHYEQQQEDSVGVSSDEV